MSFGQDAQAKAEERAKRERVMNADDDLAKDPHLARGAGGQYHCKVCITTHPTEANYKVHREGKRHKMNVQRQEESAKRATQQRQDAIASQQNPQAPERSRVLKVPSNAPLPSHNVLKYSDPAVGKRAVCITVQVPNVPAGASPSHRLMNSHEQRVEPVNPKVLYLLVACEPYKTVGFKIPTQGLEQQNITTHWDVEKKTFTVHLYYPTK